jgi:hypothetical protein
VLRRVVELLRERLPPEWSTRLRDDAVLEVAAPGGATGYLAIEAKRTPTTRDLASVPMKSETGDPTIQILVAARYLAPSTRAWLDGQGLSYVDATGNLRVRMNAPALYISDRGADRDPWRGPGRPRGSLQGPPAARIVRSLVDLVPPLTVPELARRSGTSLGTVYRVVEFLEQEVLIERTPRGPIADVAWRPLLERWSFDYGFQHSNTIGRFLEPRGLEALTERLAAVEGLRYAVTGTLAAHRFAPYAPARLGMVYVDDLERAAELLNLRPVDTGANVLLATGEYGMVFERCDNVDGVTYAAPSQTAVDLLTGPGRSPAEARELLDWMEANESSWRR